MATRNQVILYSPHFVAARGRGDRAYRAIPPLSHLALAGPLREAGYDVRIIDAKWDADWRREIRERAPHLVAAGVTALTGPAVEDGLEFSAEVRAVAPDVPIIWGGWHATFAANQAAEDSRIDIVVRGMGERTFVEVLDALRGGRQMASIPGITYRQDGRTVSNAERLPEDINAFPPPAYDLIDPARYVCEVRRGVRVANTIFSRGCPFACDFCLDSRKKWFGLNVERMIADVEFWIGWRANHIRFYDGNFFLGKPRIVEFCNAILACGLEQKFRWMATAVGNRVVQMDGALLDLLRRAGLKQIALGAESGSDDLLQRITNKTTVANTLESIRLLTRHGINQYLFFMVGYPDEPPDALEQTLALALEAKKINPNVELFLNFTTPLPGSEVFRVALERGEIDEPRAFEDWSRFDYVHANLSDISPEYVARVERFQKFLHLAFPEEHSLIRFRPLLNFMSWPLRGLARWRLERKLYGWPVEVGLIDALRTVQRKVRFT
jgi:radical SAM superfamily enzyme YgiQ (UPF0313 family)